MTITNKLQTSYQSASSGSSQSFHLPSAPMSTETEADIEGA